MAKRISFCFYVKETSGHFSQNLLIEESANILNHIKNFTRTALKLKRNNEPLPQFFIHVLLLAEKKKKRHHRKNVERDWDAPVLAAHDPFSAFEELLQARVVNEARSLGADVTIVQFAINDIEQNYLTQPNICGGDIIDLMKVRVLAEPGLNRASEGYDHLQLDTNVIINNYALLYRLTFLERRCQFFINVYSDTNRRYTVNNKIVFLPVRAPLLSELAALYKTHLTRFLAEESSHQLVVYNELFLKALQRVSILNKNGFISFSHPELFFMTYAITGKVLQTWNNGDARDVLPSTGINATDFRFINTYQTLIDSDSERAIQLDFSAFKSYLRKHATSLTGPNEQYLRQHHTLFSHYANQDKELNDMRKFIHETILRCAIARPVLSTLIQNLITSAAEHTSHVVLARQLQYNLRDAFVTIAQPERSLSSRSSVSPEIEMPETERSESSDKSVSSERSQLERSESSDISVASKIRQSEISESLSNSISVGNCKSSMYGKPHKPIGKKHQIPNVRQFLNR